MTQVLAGLEVARINAANEWTTSFLVKICQNNRRTSKSYTSPDVHTCSLVWWMSYPPPTVQPQWIIVHYPTFEKHGATVHNFSIWTSKWHHQYSSININHLDHLGIENQQINLEKIFVKGLDLAHRMGNRRWAVTVRCESRPRILTVLLYMVCHGSHQYTPFMLAYIYQHHGSYGYYSSFILFQFILAISDNQGV